MQTEILSNGSLVWAHWHVNGWSTLGHPDSPTAEQWTVEDYSPIVGTYTVRRYGDGKPISAYFGISPSQFQI